MLKYVCHLFHSLQNLDVNMAVNNLLSRDDGEHEDHDEPFQGMFSSGTVTRHNTHTHTHTHTHYCILTVFVTSTLKCT